MTDKETDNPQGDGGSGPRIVVWVLLGAAVVIVGGIIAGTMNPSPDEPSTSAKAAAQKTAPAPAAVTESNATVANSVNFQPLVGRWVRVDTPYVIDIRSANADGKLRAEYYNPRPINVSVAQAADKNGKLQVFVELRDQGYPGSNYKLTYEPVHKLLRGVYFHAVMKQNFDVTFRRMPST